MPHAIRTFINRQFTGPGGATELISIALPLIISFACETVMMFTDRLFLSRLSGSHMAAAMGGGIMAYTFLTFFMGLFGYATAMVAQHFGAGKKESCAVVTTQAIIISLIAYPLILACIVPGYHLFKFAGIAPAQLVEQQTYFSILMMGSIFSLLRSAIGTFFSGIGKTRIIMIAALVSMVSNIGLNYLLIFGKAGFPALGIRGAAYGTLIASFLGFCTVLAVYLYYKKWPQFNIASSIRFDRPLMRELLRTGSPSGFEMLLNMIAFTTLVTTFHSCGQAVATAITITFNWDMVSFIPMIGINIAVTSLAGRYLGARQLPHVYRTAWSGLKLTSIYCSLLFIPFLFFTGSLVDLFLPATAPLAAATRPMAVFMVKMISVYILCDGAMQVFGGALRGVGDTLWVMKVSVAMHWTFATIALVMLKVLHADPVITWVAIITAFFCFGPIFLLRFKSGRWEKGALDRERVVVEKVAIS